MDLGLKGRRVLVTGASQGIGEGIARSFAAEGCDLVLTARSASNLDRIAATLRDAHGVQVETVPVDLTASGAIERIATAAKDIDVLVNNAGAIPGGDLWAIDETKWRAGWELKVFGTINLVRAIYPLLKARGKGVILNCIGMAGEAYDANYIAGTTGNAALMAFTRALGGASLDDGIRVVGINPGPVATDRIAKMLKARAAQRLGDESRFEELLSGYPLGRAATVEELADLFVYLASDRSAYTSGTIVTVDGGITSRRSIG